MHTRDRNTFKKRLFSVIGKRIPSSHILRYAAEKVSGKLTYNLNFLNTFLLNLTRPNPYEKYNHNNRCIFIHIPRTGGTSISDNLFGESRQGHIPLYVYKAYNKDIYNKYFKFSFVRNPYDRIVSAFHQTKRDKHNSEWSKRYLYDIHNFEEFLRKMYDEVIFRKIILSTCFFRPQWEFIYSDGKIDVDFVGRFENIEEDFRIIKDKLSLGSDLKKMNTSSHNKYTNYYDKKGLNFIYELYREDFKKFGYEKIR